MVQYICVYIICPIPSRKMCVHLLSTAVCTTVELGGTKLRTLPPLVLRGIWWLTNFYRYMYPSWVSTTQRVL